MAGYMETFYEVGITSFLLRMIASYLDSRSLIYRSEEGVHVKDLCCGVIQGLVLGPSLWNSVAMGDEDICEKELKRR